ncbi:MAG TPA: hypothetical protein V6D10_01420 [Trichocoleus sp.]|jgi:hypothetical protein
MKTELFELFDNRSLTTLEIKDALIASKRTACYPVVKRLLALLQSEGVEFSQVMGAAIEVIEEQQGSNKDWERCLHGLHVATDFAQAAELDHPITFE